MAASLEQQMSAKGEASSEWFKLSHLEDRLMRLNIKVHETLRQVLTLVSVFNDQRGPMPWFCNKLSHELQDFVEAERLRLGMRNLPDSQANNIIKLKLRLILTCVIADTDMPQKNIEYLKVAEANFFKLLQEGDTIESLSQQLNVAEDNPFPFYNSLSKPESFEMTWVWSFEANRYLLLKQKDAQQLKHKVEDAKKLLGLEGIPVKYDNDLEEPEGEASKVDPEAKQEAKLEAKIEAPEKPLDKASGSSPCAEA